MKEKLKEIKKQLLKSALCCPVCLSVIEQQRMYHEGRYYLGDCICSQCGVRIAKYKYPIKIINKTYYAYVKYGNKNYVIDPVGRCYQVIPEIRTDESVVNNSVGRGWHRESYKYTVDTLKWVGLIEELWSTNLW